MEIQTDQINLRQRSSRRLRHEAQTKVFRDQKGSLEAIRKGLGLRPSQICEILKVHPSAWTRWVKTQKAPPHVYQMLEWYLEILKWRGQNHPIVEHQTEPLKTLRLEDPESYVEAGPTIKDQESHKVQRILILVWCIQTILWCIVLGVLLKRS
jgi:DNA-binding transcriptional regulator YiaG